MFNSLLLCTVLSFQQYHVKKYTFEVEEDYLLRCDAMMPNTGIPVRRPRHVKQDAADSSVYSPACEGGRHFTRVIIKNDAVSLQGPQGKNMDHSGYHRSKQKKTFLCQVNQIPISNKYIKLKT